MQYNFGIFKEVKGGGIMHQIEYAALKYYNNVISEECLYIGMLFHNLTTGAREFRHISNFRRFQSFDDEADINFVKLYLEGIKHQVEESLFNYNKPFSIADFSKIYVNEFRFSDAKVMEVAENEDYVGDLTKMYLKFDFNKRERLSISEEKKYIRKILAAKNVEFSTPKILGTYNENISFDYIIGDIAIKLFSFKEKDTTKLLPSAKQWAFSAGELKERYQIVFLYDEADDSQQLKIIMQILKKHAKVYQMQDGLDYLLEAI